MQKRNCRVEIRFTKDELSALTKKARKSRLTNAAFIREAIAGTEIKEAPPTDFPELVRLIRKMEAMLCELIQLEKRSGGKTVREVQQLLEDIRKMDALIWSEFI